MGQCIENNNKLSPDYVPDIRILNKKLNDCYRTHIESYRDVEWNRAIYRALRIVNEEE